MSNQHVLKIHPAPLADLLSGAKTAEVRRNDRDFQVGDTVALREVNPFNDVWTGRPYPVRTISHIQTGYGLPDGLCVLSYAQGAQAGDERTAFEDEFDRRGFELDRLPSGAYLIPAVRFGWEGWQARAALATQPAAGEPVAIANRGKGAFWVRWTDAAEGLYGPGIKLYTAQPAAAHGDGLHFSTTDDLASAIRQVLAYEELGPELIAEEMFKQAGHGDEAVRKGEWRPIETAPADGTEILLCRGSRVTAGAWVEWSSTDSIHDSSGAYLGQSEYASGADWGSWDGGFTEEEPPTHWMPMPPAMRAQAGEDAS